jgi:hypothetical protein
MSVLLIWFIFIWSSVVWDQTLPDICMGFFLHLDLYICMRVCVCVCVCERERRNIQSIWRRTMGWTAGILFPKAARLFSSPHRPTRAPGPTQTPIQWERGALFSEVKRLGRETGYLSPSSAEFKNGGTISQLPSMCSWHSASLIKHKHKFTSLCVWYFKQNK